MLAAMTSLTACAATISEPPPRIICPAIAEYPADLQDRAADELASLGQGAALRTFMQDYRELRARLRACRASATAD